MTARERDDLIRETGWELHCYSPKEGPCSFWVVHAKAKRGNRAYFDLALEYMSKMGSYRLVHWVDCNKTEVRAAVAPILRDWHCDGVVVDLEPNGRSLKKGHVCDFYFPGIDEGNIFARRAEIVAKVNAIRKLFEKHGFLSESWMLSLPCVDESSDGPCEKCADADPACDPERFRALDSELDEFPVRKALLQMDEDQCRFNILNVLGLSNYEIRHSFMLAWLLDPSATHGLGNLFLKALIERAVSANRGRVYGWLQELGRSDGRIAVSREADDIDILVVDESQKIVLVIENKWDAAEREDSDDQVGQLRKYYNGVSSCYPAVCGWRSAFLFLSPTGRAPSVANRDTWGVLSYRDVLFALNDVLDARSKLAEVEDGVEILIRHYAQIVERKVNMENQEFKDQCEALYRKYQDVIDYIVEHVDTRPPVLAKVAEGVNFAFDGVCDQLRCENESQRYVQFKRRFPADAQKSVHYEVWCPKGTGKIVIALHVEEDADERIADALLSELSAVQLPNGFRRKGAKKDGKPRHVEKEIRMAGRNTDELYEETISSLRALYQACEPTLRKYEEMAKHI